MLLFEKLYIFTRHIISFGLADPHNCNVRWKPRGIFLRFIRRHVSTHSFEFNRLACRNGLEYSAWLLARHVSIEVILVIGKNHDCGRIAGRTNFENFIGVVSSINARL